MDRWGGKRVSTRDLSERAVHERKRQTEQDLFSGEPQLEGLVSDAIRVSFQAVASSISRWIIECMSTA